MENITQHDLDKLAELSWWLKGYGAATENNYNNCSFNDSHLEALEKIQKALKEKLGKSEETEITL